MAQASLELTIARVSLSQMFIVLADDSIRMP